MTITNAPQNLFPQEPDLKDLLKIHAKDIFLNFNCHHIGTIQSFDSTNQTAQVTINYTNTFLTYDPSSETYIPTAQSYPIVVDAPCIVLGGGGRNGGSLTFPIAAGDECLLLFNDRDMDNWFSGNSGSPPATPRLHSFADGIALVGLRSMANVLTGYDILRTALRQGQSLVAVGGGGGTLVKIANGTTTLNTLLQSLCIQLEALTAAIAAITVPVLVTGITTGPDTAPGSGGPPNNATTITGIGSQIITIATEISGLLE